MGLYVRNDLRLKGQTKANAVRKDSRVVLAENFGRINNADKFDIFLSHSYLDSNEILGLKLEFEAAGFSVYVDWVVDKSLDRTKVDRQTAATLRTRLRQCRCLVYAFTENSQSSVWMPWELGYFDAFKNKVAVLPILQASRAGLEYNGQEYLGLYPYAFHAPAEGGNGSELIWVCTAPRTYKEFKGWLNGQ